MRKLVDVIALILLSPIILLVSVSVAAVALVIGSLLTIIIAALLGAGVAFGAVMGVTE